MHDAAWSAIAGGSLPAALAPGLCEASSASGHVMLTLAPRASDRQRLAVVEALLSTVNADSPGSSQALSLAALLRLVVARAAQLAPAEGSA
jgi:hypothetical protein